MSEFKQGGSNEIRTVFQKGFPSTLPQVVAELAAEMAKTKVTPRHLDIYMAPVLDAAGNKYEYLPTALPVDDNNKFQYEYVSQTERDNFKPSVVVKQYVMPGGASLQVKYIKCRVPGVQGSDVIRPLSWGQEDSTLGIIQEFEGLYQLMSDVLPLEAFVRANIETPNQMAGNFTGETFLNAMAGLIPDASGKMRPDDLSAVMRFSRVQLLLAAEAGKENFKALKDAANNGGVSLSRPQVELDAVTSARFDIVEDVGSTIVSADRYNKPLGANKEKTFANAFLGVTPGGGSEVTFKKR